MLSKVFDIALLAVVFGSGIFGVYYTIRLRVQSNQTAMKTKSLQDQDVVQIFEEMEKKAKELNPELLVLSQQNIKNQQLLESYQEFMYANNDNQTVTLTNQVTI